jgi:hypothetical protein
VAVEGIEVDVDGIGVAVEGSVIDSIPTTTLAKKHQVKRDVVTSVKIHEER